MVKPNQQLAVLNATSEASNVLENARQQLARIRREITDLQRGDKETYDYLQGFIGACADGERDLTAGLLRFLQVTIKA
jgi:hypothetical protein